MLLGEKNIQPDLDSASPPANELLGCLHILSKLNQLCDIQKTLLCQHFRGFVYIRNADIGPGKVAVGQGQLLYRPQSFDGEAENSNFFQVLDKHTLQVSLHCYSSFSIANKLIYLCFLLVLDIMPNTYSFVDEVGNRTCY